MWQLSAECSEPPVKRSFEPFTPSLRFLQTVVPFFDQYAHSQTPWSPDSSAFCFATVDGAVRVQRLDAPPTDASRKALWQQLGIEQPAPEPETLGGAPDADLVLWSPR